MNEYNIVVEYPGESVGVYKFFVPRTVTYAKLKEEIQMQQILHPKMGYISTRQWMGDVMEATAREAYGRCQTVDVDCVIDAREVKVGRTARCMAFAD